MCGIAGIWSHDGADARAASAMADVLVHRGPDDHGVWSDPHAGISLSHRRLSIIDPSRAGHQPMISNCGRFVLTFNGEIYNHLAMRVELDAIDPRPWRGHSDTETLVRCIARWGLPDTLRRASGMFALGLWDQEARTLSLARDRMGEKPLYYGWSRGRILFGSELKALRAVHGFEARTDPHALADYLRHNVVPAPRSILRDVYKVEPATIVSIDAAALDAPPLAPPVPGGPPVDGLGSRLYWSIDAVVSAPTDATLTDAEAIDDLERVLRAAVAEQMIADVPLGAFLSGGIDSSAIVALMTDIAPGRVNTFTIGFGEDGFDEAPHARAVAEHLGTDHREWRVTSEDVRAVIPDLPRIYDEPFADSSQLPTVLLSRMTRGSVAVALSGDGGDELFCGYNRYLMSRRLWNGLARIPLPVRRVLSGAIGAVPAQAWDRLGTARLADVPMLGSRMHKISRMLPSTLDAADIHRASSEQWQEGLPLLSPSTRTDLPWLRLRDTPEEQMMHRDMTRYLPDDIMTKVDRAAMASGLETRAPFLNHHVVEAAWRTPLSRKKRDGQGKWLLRQLLYRRVPPSLIDRPKAGFAVPIGSWLRGDLRDWAEDLLSVSTLREDPLLDQVAIRARWSQHVDGTHDWTASLWSVLMYRAWDRGLRC